MKKILILTLLTAITFSGQIAYATPITSEIEQVTPKAAWANVNRIDLGQFDSSLVELEVGQTLTVSGVASFSGDQAAIDQATVLFEDIDPALTINYDGNFVINGQTGTFTFTVTLNSDENRPHTFKITIADSLINDDNHLTPYSETQTIIASTSTSSSTSSSTSESSSSSSSSSSTSESSSSSSSSSSTSESSSSSSSSSSTFESSSSSSSSSSTSESSSSSISSSSTFESSSNRLDSVNSNSRSVKPDFSPSKRATLPYTGEQGSSYLLIIGILLLTLSFFLIGKKSRLNIK